MSPAANPMRYLSPFENGYHTYGIREVNDMRKSDEWWEGFATGWAEVTGRTLWSGEDGTKPITVVRKDGWVKVSVIAR